MNRGRKLPFESQIEAFDVWRCMKNFWNCVQPRLPGN